MTEPEVEKAKKGGASHGAQATVLAYFTKHANQSLYINDIVEDTKLEKRVAQTAIANLRYRNVDGAKERLEVVLRGQTWIWHTGTTNSSGQIKLDDLYVLRLVTSSGTRIVESEDGKLYPLGPEIV